MKKVIKRYTINAITDRNVVAIAKSTLEIIDRTFTNFDNKEELIEVVKDNFNLKAPVNDIKVTYNCYGRQELSLIFKDHRWIAANPKLGEKLIQYLSSYSNVKEINVDTLKHEFLNKRIESLKNCKDNAEFIFYHNIFASELKSNYKLQRDLVLYLENKIDPEVINKFKASAIPVNKNEIQEYFDKMTIIKQNNKNNRNSARFNEIIKIIEDFKKNKKTRDPQMTLF